MTAFRAVTPISGTTIIMRPDEPGLYIEGSPLAVLTIRLPPTPRIDMLVEISFQNPVTSLAVQDSEGAAVTGGPVKAYGPGAGLQFRFIDSAWRYWK